MFDVPASYQGKTCNMVFTLPPPFDSQFMSPLTIASSGGISASLLDRPATAMESSNTVSSAQSIGSVPVLLPGNKYSVGGAPCAAGQQVGYRVDSIGGLDMSFFQMAFSTTRAVHGGVRLALESKNGWHWQWS